MVDIADDMIGGIPCYGHLIRRDRPVTCAQCGATNLKWRWVEGDKWILVHNERVHPGNYKPEHVCPTSADGFEEVE